MTVSRRKVLIGSASVAGGLLIGFSAYSVLEARTQSRAAQLTQRDGALLLAGWITIAPDDVTTVFIPHADIGQGTHTALAMMLAEELDADWSKVRAQQAPADDAFANWFLAEGFTLEPGALFNAGFADPVFKVVARRMGLQLTGGSTAVRFTGNFGMRHVGAGARQMLIKAAAVRWGVRTSGLTTRDSRVIDAATGRELRYGELVESAVQMPVPLRPMLKAKENYRLVGQPILRPDIPLKVFGSYVYGIDVQLPELLYATSKAAPVHGGTLDSVDPAPALAMAGVAQVIAMTDSVAVVAREPWQAFNAIDALAPVFRQAHAVKVTSQSIYADQLQALNDGKREVKLRIGRADEMSISAARKIESLYCSPFLHHAQMEPINITAQWKEDHLTVWTGAQDPLTARKFSAKVAQLSLEQVTLHPLPLGGSFGRKTGPDADCIYYRQIVEIARRCSPAPVKLIWSRAEDTSQGWYRAQTSSRIHAALNSDGLPVAWSQVFIQGQPGRSVAYPLPYEIPHQIFEEVQQPNHLRKGPLRSVNSTQHGFWRECFIDELAHATARNPLDYRLALLHNDARSSRVLQEVAQRSGWKAALPSGSGRGIALHVEYGTSIALVIEASWHASSVKVHRVCAVVDCGELVHPDTAAQQIEGAVIMGLSNAIDEEITIANGAVVEKLFSDYRILTLADTPQIDVHFLASDAPAGGLGEVGVPAAAPALANALFAATGHRLRRTPLNSALREAIRDHTMTRA